MFTRQRRNWLPVLLLFGLIAGVYIWARNYGPLADAPAANSTEAPPTSVAAEASPTAFATDVPPSDATPSPTPIIHTLFIPEFQRSVPVYYSPLDASIGSWDVSLIGTNVGHLQGTTDLDAVGNIVLAGHVEMRDGRQGAFFGLEQLGAGDELILFVNNRIRRFAIAEIYNTSPDDLQPIFPSDTSRLTLITCDDYDFVNNTYNTRIIVVANEL